MAHSRGGCWKEIPESEWEVEGLSEKKNELLDEAENISCVSLCQVGENKRREKTPVSSSWFVGVIVQEKVGLFGAE